MSVFIILIIAIVILIVLAWLVFDLKRELTKSQSENKEDGKILAVILQQYNELKRVMDNRLSETHQATQEQINHTIKTVQGITSQSARQIGDVIAGLTKLEETNKQVINFSAQLQNLQDILKNPKQRGILGEFFLEETLKNVLPPNSYQIQYKFEGGLVADAVVFVRDKIIPVDSKFSLENYERILNTNDGPEREKLEKLFRLDVKNRIDETSKYILPEEGTMDFAFMFIPSEAIYYDLLVNKVGATQINTRDLIEYAFQEKKVIIVSPTSFLAYLQTVLQGLRGLQIEESAKQIRTNVEKLGKHMLSFEEFMKKLGGSLGTTVNNFNSAYKELGKIDKDVVKITDGDKNIEPLILDKPKEE
jgi:DNA recombination protein RmuC